MGPRRITSFCIIFTYTKSFGLNFIFSSKIFKHPDLSGFGVKILVLLLTLKSIVILSYLLSFVNLLMSIILCDIVIFMSIQEASKIASGTEHYGIMVGLLEKDQPIAGGTYTYFYGQPMNYKNPLEKVIILHGAQVHRYYISNYKK